MNRRFFLRNTLHYGISGIVIPGLVAFPEKPQQGELLYNGIRLPLIWPPRDMNPNSYDPMPVPYLCNPPKVIPINIGRQLFIDDYLIENTNLNREFHSAEKYNGNPVLKAETELEHGVDGLPIACPKDGGVWWDPKDKIFKMWYEAGWIGSMAYATSRDGINWIRPHLDVVPGTNQILPNLRPDSTTVFLDHDAKNPHERFKMFLRGPNFLNEYNGYSLVSPDGIHWSNPLTTGYCGDRSTMFYNPFRRKWVYSIRSGGPLKSGNGRARYFHEHSDFLKGAKWEEDEVLFWTGADRLDPPDPEIGNRAQLYNLSAVAYESLMLGIHQIHLGPPNSECQKQGRPKTTELMLSFSRDGFHWHRPNRKAFVSASRDGRVWDRGYVQSVGGICSIVGDQLWFYYTGFKGDPNNLNPDDMKNGMYANGSTGIAILRRDGFASMFTKNEGQLVTRPITFNGSNMFVNTDCPDGELRIEILNEDGTVIAPFSAVNCERISSNSTLQAVKWKNITNLSSMNGKIVRLRFHLKNGHLYSFWVSSDKNGSSQGYVAAGGPGYTGSKDDVGKLGYNVAEGYKIRN